MPEWPLCAFRQKRNTEFLRFDAIKKMIGVDDGNKLLAIFKERRMDIILLCTPESETLWSMWFSFPSY